MSGPAPTQDSNMECCATCDGSGFTSAPPVSKRAYDALKRERDALEQRIAAGLRDSWWRLHGWWVVVLAVLAVAVPCAVWVVFRHNEMNAAEIQECLKMSGATRCECHTARADTKSATECYIGLARAGEPAHQ